VGTLKVGILPGVVDVSKLDTEQFISDKKVRTSQVMRELRRQCRELCGIPNVADCSPISLAEAKMIFVFCYIAHKGTESGPMTRVMWTLSDLRYYTHGDQKGVLPYHVIRTYDLNQIPTLHVAESTKDTYRAACAMGSQDIPDYSREAAGNSLERYRLPPV
jgi:hypothetical protein